MPEKRFSRSMFSRSSLKSKSPKSSKMAVVIHPPVSVQPKPPVHLRPAVTSKVVNIRVLIFYFNLKIQFCG